MKLKISDEAVLRMHELSMIGVDDKDIGKRMGVCTNVVARSLARVAQSHGGIGPIKINDGGKQ